MTACMTSRRGLGNAAALPRRARAAQRGRDGARSRAEPRCSRSQPCELRACAGRCSRSRASCRRYRASRCSPFLSAAARVVVASPSACSGTGFSALGFLPSLLALTLYSMLPMIRNGVTGILNLDPAVIEAARGVGMTDWQRLRRVELPLAAPLLMAGVRTAAVLGDRRSDARDARRPDEPRQLHLLRPADPELGGGAVRLRRGRGARARRRPAARR